MTPTQTVPDANITSTDLVEMDTIPREALGLAQRLSYIHGSGYFSREAGGLHYNCPSPYCIGRYGTGELYKKHLAINVDKYLGIGKWQGRKKVDFAAQCMKSGTKYKVSELLAMPELAERGIKESTEPTVQRPVNKNYFIQDADGHWVPIPAGEVTPLHELPEDHPAVFYVKQRGFDPEKLFDHLGAAYCHKEYPEDWRKGIRYMRCAGGFKNTPQGRIIFRVVQNGVDKGWQGRFIDYTDDNGVYWAWHPYDNQWTAVRQGDQWFPGFTAETFKIQKYRTGYGTQRNSVLMGLDWAIWWNGRYNSNGKPTVVLLEGPLDVARWGPPAVGVLGKWFSPEQAGLLAYHFQRILVPTENDQGGEKLWEKVESRSAEKRLAAVRIPLPAHRNDVGELSIDELNQLKEQYKPC